jgi:hypothetical protein
MQYVLPVRDALREVSNMDKVEKVLSQNKIHSPLPTGTDTHRVKCPGALGIVYLEATM